MSLRATVPELMYSTVDIFGVGATGLAVGGLRGEERVLMGCQAGSEEVLHFGLSYHGMRVGAGRQSNQTLEVSSSTLDPNDIINRSGPTIDDGLEPQCTLVYLKSLKLV